jgi:RNA polymerase sigma-70 factor, ECF subfamily
MSMHALVEEVPRSLDLASIYRAHAKTVARWAARLGGPDLDAEDIVHEVFVVVARKLSTFRGEAQVTTWLYQITARIVRHERRRARFRSWLGLAEVEEPRDTRPSPLEESEQRARERSLYRLLDRLPEKYRTVIILHEIDQRSAMEIAELTAVAQSTVWVQLHRARATLRALAKKEGLS